jgi:glycosyltransferase involved in cell wall biosynthesis
MKENSNDPLFSIVTCTYNSERFVQRNIDSVRFQTFKNYEHIFIDGYSKDRTVQIIRDYLSKSKSKVKLFQFPPLGISDAFNKGISKSRGKWIIFLNSDDYLNDSCVLEDVYNYLLGRPNVDVLYAKATFLKYGNSEVKRIIPHRDIYKKVYYWLLLITNYIPHQSVFTKRLVFEKYGYFDEELKSSMDYEMWLRLSKEKVNFSFFDRKIAFCVIRKDAMSQSGLAKLEHPKILDKYIKNKFLAFVLKLIYKINSLRNLI